MRGESSSHQTTVLDLNEFFSSSNAFWGITENHKWVNSSPKIYKEPFAKDSYFTYVQDVYRACSGNLQLFNIFRTCIAGSNGLYLCRRHTTASMEPTQITLAIRSTLNTTCIIQQYMHHQNLAKRNRASRRHQRGDESDEDMDTDFSQTMGPGNVGITVLMGQVHVVER
ncbi:hypothetical protein UY3_16350 [Chelonia mydas]|uniref:Uncharacterized protein n=1 Tax=Chelonia mydas TaxID=8469 RepID=M7AUB5_CHEMY|nr:hypothetical protein UY3_16350 [Chelonia mydas]